jgi:hypothetical protein
MGLYLCVFASPTEDIEIEGVEVGSYDDLHLLRSTVAGRLEGGEWGSRFPVLMSHSDCDGEWTEQEALTLSHELRTIGDELAALPPTGFVAESWQSGVAKMIGLVPSSLADCFIDVDGKPLLGRLRDLAEIAAERGCPISFQ